MESFARHFRQEAIADVDLVILLLNEAQCSDSPRRSAWREGEAGLDDAEASAPLHLAVIPAHKIILFSSDISRCSHASLLTPSPAAAYEQQAQHWLPQPTTSSKKRSRDSIDSLQPLHSRQALHLTINSAEQLPAAEAVIAAMYGVPDAVSSLEQQQLVHTVVIADMVHARNARQQAVQALEAAAKAAQGLSASALEALAALPAWPACLLQLLPSIVQCARCCQDTAADLAAVAAADTGARVQRLLLVALGDLEAVWADTALRELLLQLPLPAMQLLLSASQLRVASEDTVLFTAKAYVVAQDDAAAAAAQAALSQLVRVPQLSVFALSSIVLSLGIHEHLLGKYSTQLRALFSLGRFAAVGAAQLAGAPMPHGVHGTPDSWKLGPRQLRPLADGVRLEWRLPVEQLRQACRDSFAQQATIGVESPDMTPPLGGHAWQLVVLVTQRDGGSTLALWAHADGFPPDLHYKCGLSVTWCGRTCHNGPPYIAKEAHVFNFSKVCDLEPMTNGGWDEAAWAAAGMPVDGEVLVQLHVLSVE